MENKIKITLKYDDGKRKNTFYVNAEEFETFLERDYQRRLAEVNPEDRECIKKMTPEEYVKMLNRESYNNWHKHNRNISGYVKNPYVDDEKTGMINPIELKEDNTTIEKIERNIELETLRKKIYKYLSKSQADLFWEVIMEDKSVEEVAKREQVTPRAIYLRLETVKKKLRKFF